MKQRIIYVGSLTGWIFLTLLSVFLISIIAYQSSLNPDTAQLIVEPGNSSLYVDDYELTIRGWDDSGRTLFFIPSYINISRLEQSGSNYVLLSETGEEIQNVAPNQIQKVIVKTDTGEMIPWEVGFIYSKNLYTMNINLNDIEYSAIDHDRYTSGLIKLISPSGRIKYEDDILIKGRGNSSWDYTLDGGKRSYQIKLIKMSSLCNLSPADKWVLIANAEDDTKIRNKLVYDMAQDIDMEYAIDSDWVDLYINNEYLGNYLLCHEPSIGKFDLNIGNLDFLSKPYQDNAQQIVTENLKGYDYNISPVPKGGYLIEKQIASYYNKKNTGFVYDGIPFSIKSPDMASIGEVEYIRDFVGKVDSCIHNEDSRTSLIDVYSFARRYLLEEISMNYDSAVTSYYFYIKPNDNRLFAGPNWDQDGAFGKSGNLRNYMDCMDKVYGFRESQDPSLTILDWDTCLRENSDYENYLASTFSKYSPVFDKYLSCRIDEYYDKLEYSLNADRIKWSGDVEGDDSIKDEYKYLKFFLYNRLTYLADEYCSKMDFTKPVFSDGSSHILTFQYPDGTEYHMSVNDGEQISSSDLPYYDTTRYDGWYCIENGIVHSFFSYYTPVYSDLTLVLVEI